MSAMLCPNCHQPVVNPAYGSCPHCSQPLPVAQPAMPSTMAPLPYGSGWAPTGTYYTPTAPAQVNRVPAMALLVGAFCVMLALVLAGGILALTGNHQTATHSTLPGVGGTVTNPGPTTIPTLPPTPVAATPAPTPSPGSSSGNQGGNAISFTAPSGWTVESQVSNEVNLINQSDGVLVILISGAAGSIGVSDPTDYINQDLQQFQQQDPNAAACVSQAAGTVPNGPSGTTFGFCFTETASDGSTESLVDTGVVGVESVNGNSILVDVEVVAASDNTNSVSQAEPLLATVTWNLIAGS